MFLFCTAAIASATNDDFLCVGTVVSRCCAFVVPDVEVGGEVGVDEEPCWKVFARSLMEFDFSLCESGTNTVGGGTLNLGFFVISSRTTAEVIVSLGI